MVVSLSCVAIVSVVGLAVSIVFNAVRRCCRCFSLKHYRCSKCDWNQHCCFRHRFDQCCRCLSLFFFCSSAAIISVITALISIVVTVVDLDAVVVDRRCSCIRPCSILQISRVIVDSFVSYDLWKFIEISRSLYLVLHHCGRRIWDLSANFNYQNSLRSF